jgi:hypothetical protein
MTILSRLLREFRLTRVPPSLDIGLDEFQDRAWVALLKDAREVFHNTRYTFNIITVLKNECRDAHTDFNDAQKSICRLNSLTRDTSTNTPSTTLSVVECLRAFLHKQVEELDDKINDIGIEIDLAVQDGVDAHLAEVEFTDRWYMFGVLIEPID